MKSITLRSRKEINTQLDALSVEKDQGDTKGQNLSEMEVTTPQDLDLSKKATHEADMLKKPKSKEETPPLYTQKVPFPQRLKNPKDT